MYKGMANFVQRRRLALAHHLESAKEYTMEGLFYENEETNIGLALTTLDVLDRLESADGYVFGTSEGEVKL